MPTLVGARSRCGPRRRHGSWNLEPGPPAPGERPGRRPAPVHSRAIPIADPRDLEAVLSRLGAARPHRRSLGLWPAARARAIAHRGRDRSDVACPTRSSAATTRAFLGFRSWVRTVAGMGFPVVFLPGGFHLPTIPAHRKVNAVDLGTADKVAVAALALWFDAARARRT